MRMWLIRTIFTCNIRIKISSPLKVTRGMQANVNDKNLLSVLLIFNEKLVRIHYQNCKESL